MHSHAGAHADWAAYLNDFKASPAGNDFLIQEITTETVVGNIPDVSGLSEFSLFLKQGMPGFLFKDLIVEPQVYIAVEHVYNKVPLSGEDRAFLPEEISIAQD